ncbi:MAG: type II CRISPR-associated endonuclease Cas1 [Gammaproteobacteria bacterium]|nr:type II CRISPR-associated endonuclease Cas1 [Gammaproteobacteria bacterium]
MIKRIIDISEPAYLHLKNNQLLIDKNGETVGTIPIEDLSIVMLENPQIVITQMVIIACQKNNIALVFCDDRHLPYSVLLPVSDGNTLHNKILREQIEISKPAKKRLWQQIVIHKIQQQVATLEKAGKNTTQLQRLATKVKSGDPENIEAQAAKKYWSLLFGDEFHRNIDEPGINSLLNYGYSIIRAMIARAIVGSGLHPALGVFHKNQYNGLCLADDLMEPFRPWVDWLVFDFVMRNGNDEIGINQKTKSIFLNFPNDSVQYKEKNMPFMVACHYLLADFKKVFEDSRFKLHYPGWPRQIALI